MPATYTHHVFTLDVYKALNDNVKEKLASNIDAFNLFGKSFDALLFGDMKLGNYAHNNNVNLYFKNIIEYIRENNLYDDSQVLAYLYGSICHYVLDSVAHPYIYYKSGRYDVKDRSTYKYKGKHDKIEFMIDAIIYQERNNKPIYKVSVGKKVFSKIKFNETLKNIIDYAYLNTFNVEKGYKVYNIGYRNYRFLYKHIFVSSFGIKAVLYRLIDATSLIKRGKIMNFCYYIRELDKAVLNLEHNKWCYPVDKKMSYHYSFYDLYDIAIEKARKLIETLDAVLGKDENDIKQVLKEIGNNGYATGKNCDKNYQMKYFEF